MKQSYLIIISLLGTTLQAKIVVLNTSVSTIVELRNNYYRCTYDDKAHTVLCVRNQTAPLGFPLKITFGLKNGIHTECSLALANNTDLVGTYNDNNTICSILISKINQLGQTTYDEWTESYQED